MSQTVALPPTADAAPSRGAGSERLSVRTLIARYGVLIAMGIAVIVFSALRPDAFLTLKNLEAIITQAAIPAMVAIGLTFVLVMGDFDLSFGSTLGLAGAVAAVAMSTGGVSWPLAVLLALGAGVLVGAVNGVLVAYAGASSLIATLAMGSVITGIEFALTDQKTIFRDIAPTYVRLGQGNVFGIRSTILIALGMAVIAALVLRRSEIGRYMYAVGANEEAARLCGVRTKLLRFVGFVLMGLAAAVAGVVLSAQAAASYPNAGTPYLLPAFAAVFLGAAAVGRGRFTILGTLAGVLFLGIIRTGLTIMNLPAWVVMLFTGGVLLAAILLSRLDAEAA